MFDDSSRPSGRLFRLWTATVPESQFRVRQRIRFHLWSCPPQMTKAAAGKPWRLLVFKACASFWHSPGVHCAFEIIAAMPGAYRASTLPSRGQEKTPEKKPQ
jgi:hypothetical protein